MTAPRRAFVLNAVVSVSLIVLVATLALVVRPPAPPGIAAFAPQATKPITKAPLGQGSQHGNGSGTCVARQVCASPTGGPAGTSGRPVPRPSGDARDRGVPSALQCYTWPNGSVTQTFDPQSAPCIADWPGQAQGNGGVTSPGVTRTTVRIAYPLASAGSTYSKVKPLVDFFNNHYQFYGRKLELVPFASQQAGQYTSPEREKADAAQVSRLNVFASTDFVDSVQSNMTTPVYADALAQHGIVSVVGGVLPSNINEAGLEAHAPYEWSYYPTFAELVTNMGHATCRQLVGRRATHAASYRTARRKFAFLLLRDQYFGALPGLRELRQQLASCGAGDVNVYYYDPVNDPFNPAPLTQTMVDLKSQGITSLIFEPWYNGPAPGTPQKIASQVGYQPEWVTIGITDYLIATIAANREQAASTFGIGIWNKLGPIPNEPWGRAYLESGGSSDDAHRFPGGNLYHNLLLLAAGIQMAGPHLTPRTFADALGTTTFPNPNAGTVPSYQAAVDLTGGQHAMIHDFQAFWLDPSDTNAVSAVAPLETYQSFCYQALGTRWSRTGWPAGDRFFARSCR